MKTIYLYGVGDPADTQQFIRYNRIDEDCFSIMTFKYEAMKMRLEFPSIKRVFAIDNSYSTYRAYKDIRRNKSMDEFIAFIDMLEKQGVEIDSPAICEHA